MVAWLMNINDDGKLVEAFIKKNMNIETPDNIPLEVVFNTILTNARRTLLSLKTGQNGFYAVRSDSTGLGFVIKTSKVKKGEKSIPKLIAVLPYYKGGKSAASGAAALEKQLDFYVRDRLKSAGQKINAAQKSHETIEFEDLKFTYWEGKFYDSNMIDMVIIK